MQTMQILSIGQIEEGQDHILLLKETDGPRILPMVIGPYEAASIALGMERAAAPRPLTHDLLLHVIGRLGGELQRVVIHDVRNETYICQLEIQTERGILEIDCRPSDAIAVAVRAGVPIIVTEDVLEASAVVPDED
ncbi:MAG: bifunctional nuclease family protein [Clostridia bacterium]|nr:bifunctional nuclease family protein [Clostridia bacterium]